MILAVLVKDPRLAARAYRGVKSAESVGQEARPCSGTRCATRASHLPPPLARHAAPAELPYLRPPPTHTHTMTRSSVPMSGPGISVWGPRMFFMPPTWGRGEGRRAEGGQARAQCRGPPLGRLHRAKGVLHKAWGRCRTSLCRAGWRAARQDTLHTTHGRYHQVAAPPPPAPPAAPACASAAAARAPSAASGPGKRVRSEAVAALRSGHERSRTGAPLKCGAHHPCLPQSQMVPTHPPNPEAGPRTTATPPLAPPKGTPTMALFQVLMDARLRSRQG